MITTETRNISLQNQQPTLKSLLVALAWHHETLQLKKIASLQCQSHLITATKQATQQQLKIYKKHFFA